MAVYDQASLALDDDYEDVRMAAIKLVWVFSQADPERLVDIHLLRLIIVFMAQPQLMDTYHK